MPAMASKAAARTTTPIAAAIPATIGSEGAAEVGEPTADEVVRPTPAN